MSDDRPSPITDATTGSGTSLSMLQRMRGQDADAWRRFVDLYSPLVLSWLRRAGLGDADAADLVQDVFLLVSRHVEGFDRRGAGSFRGWMFTITANKVREHHRARKGQPVAAGGTDAQRRVQELTDDVDPEDPSDPGSRDGLVRRGLELIRGDFAEQTWQAFWRCVVEGRPAAEVAVDLGMKPNAVYQARHRILRRLREELGELLDDTDLPV